MATAAPSVSSGSMLEARIEGSFRVRFAQELFRNSGLFPLANLVLELLLGGWGAFLGPDLYVLVVAALAQAYVLTRWEHSRSPRRFIGNLVGPLVYTVVEFGLEGPRFFASPNHLAYWVFAVLIGAVQAARLRAATGVGALVVIENVVRALILFAMYAIFEALSAPEKFARAAFFADSAHVFIALATLILGLSAGLAALSEHGYLGLLRETSSQLKRYSEWLLGPELLERVIADPSVLTLARRDRTVVFMDIRAFTAWSERCSPETVVQALNEYYEAAEPLLRRHGAIKLKFSADEVLGVFSEPRQATACALELRSRTLAVLSRWGLEAGIGVHAGPVVEGLLGSAGLQAYDVIGDTVNTAKRIEGAAKGGEVLVSESVRAALDPATPLGPGRQIIAKGKETPIEVHPLL